MSFVNESFHRFGDQEYIYIYTVYHIIHDDINLFFHILHYTYIYEYIYIYN